MSTIPQPTQPPAPTVSRKRERSPEEDRQMRDRLAKAREARAMKRQKLEDGPQYDRLEDQVFEMNQRMEEIQEQLSKPIIIHAPPPANPYANLPPPAPVRAAPAALPRPPPPRAPAPVVPVEKAKPWYQRIAFPDLSQHWFDIAKLAAAGAITLIASRIPQASPADHQTAAASPPGYVYPRPATPFLPAGPAGNNVLYL